MNKKELTEIVVLVQKDNSQFEKLYRAIANKLYFWCYGITGDKTEANDLSQDVMLAIYKGINGLKNPEYFTSWMYQTARRSGINYMKKLNKKSYQFLDDENFSESFDSQLEDKRIESMPEMVLDLKQTKELLLQFIQQLPRKQQEIIYLRYFEELQVNEIADILDYNPGTIKSSLFNARQNLKVQIESYQRKNSIRLYGTGLIPLIVLTYQDYVNDICKSNKMTYHAKQFQPKLVNLIHTSLSSITTVIATSFIVVGLVISLVVYSQSKSELNSIDEDRLTELMNTKLKKYSYIMSYSYYHFPSRNVLVSVKLSEEIDHKNISVVYKSREVFNWQDKNILYFEATENGKYEVSVNDEKVTINITNITQDAPFLTTVNQDSFNAYLELNIDGNKELIDYSKSYVIYQNKQYPISNDNIVKGQFTDKIQVILFDQENNFISYDINLLEE